MRMGQMAHYARVKKRSLSFRDSFRVFLKKQKFAQRSVMKEWDGDFISCTCDPERKKKISVGMRKVAHSNAKTFAFLMKKLFEDRD